MPTRCAKDKCCNATERLSIPSFLRNQKASQTEVWPKVKNLQWLVRYPCRAAAKFFFFYFLFLFFFDCQGNQHFFSKSRSGNEFVVKQCSNMQFSSVFQHFPSIYGPLSCMTWTTLPRFCPQPVWSERDNGTAVSEGVRSAS